MHIWDSVNCIFFGMGKHKENAHVFYLWPYKYSVHLRWTFFHTTAQMWYCKRCYFRGIKFSRLAAQKHIRGLLNSRWADAHLSFLYCTKLTSFNEWWYIYKYLYVTGQHKNKAGLRQSGVYYSFASTQLLRVQNVHTKYRKYFRGFLNSRLLNFAQNSWKLMYREYFHFYSIVSAGNQRANTLINFSTIDQYSCLPSVNF